MQWHRIAGGFIKDKFKSPTYQVTVEKELSFKGQRLDMVLFYHETLDDGKLKRPDGFDRLCKHNLISYKSMHESLDAWVILELLGHYVNYRKQETQIDIKTGEEGSIPEQEIGLYAISTLYPKNLSTDASWRCLKPGVYELTVLGRSVRIIVPKEVEQAPHNAIWRLLSGVSEQVMEGLKYYGTRQDELGYILIALCEKYDEEGVYMPYTLEDLKRDVIREHIDVLSPDEVLGRYSPDEVLGRYSPDEVLGRYSPQDRLKGLSLEEIIKHLSAEELQALLETLNKQNKK